MAKVYGLNGLVTGKIGSAVYVIRKGQQIARQYNPSPDNPKSERQVEQRAKLKLLSQLSAVMAPVIAMRPEGAVSARNVFSRVNYPAMTYDEGVASVNLESVKLTNSVISLPELVVTREGASVTVRLEGRRTEPFSRVIYVVFQRETDGKLRYVSSITATTPTESGTTYITYPATFTLTRVTDHVVIYGYGVTDLTDQARSMFGNLNVTAETFAQVVSTRVLTVNDILVTETRAVVSKPA